MPLLAFDACLMFDLFCLINLFPQGNPSTGTPPGSRRTSLLPPPRQDGGSPLHVERIAPPIQHFLQTSADELRISEVSALLADYKRVVEALRGMGGFQE